MKRTTIKDILLAVAVGMVVGWGFLFVASWFLEFLVWVFNH